MALLTFVFFRFNTGSSIVTLQYLLIIRLVYLTGDLVTSATICIMASTLFSNNPKVPSHQVDGPRYESYDEVDAA